ncbi:MAG: ATP-binding protein [Tenuifilaceae bacterium]|nr:ATP-binding protein [Tenuifilaceae bacterium]
MKQFCLTTIVLIILTSIFISFHDVVAQSKGSVFAQHYLPVSKIDGQRFGRQNWAVTEDKAGRLYFGNNEGVLSYDGVHWDIIALSNKSPARSLAVDASGTIYVGGYNEFGYLLPNNKGEMVYRSLSDNLDDSLKDFSEVWRTTEVNDSVFFMSEKYLFCYANNKISHRETGFDKFYLTYKLNNKIYVQVIGLGIMHIVNGELIPLNLNKKLLNQPIHAILPVNNGYAICTRNSGIYLVGSLSSNQELVSLSDISANAALVNNYVTENVLYNAIALPNSNLALGLISGEVLIVNPNWEVVDVINSELLGVNSAVYDLFMNSQGVLWLGLDYGVAKAEVFSAYRYWKENRGISGTLADVARIRDTLYLSTGAGIYFMPTHGSKGIEPDNFQEINVKVEQAWEFLYFLPQKENWKSPYDLYDATTFDDQNTKLLAATIQGIVEINGTSSKIISGYNKVFALHQFRKDPSKLLVGLSDGVVLLEYSNGKWIDWGYQQGINKIVNSIGEDEEGNLWFSSAYTGLYRLNFPFTLTTKKTNKFDLFDTKHGFPSVSNIYIFDEYKPIMFRDEYFNMYYFDSTTDMFTLVDSAHYASLHIPSPSQSYDDGYARRIESKRLTNTYVSRLTDTVLWMQTTYGLTRFMDEHPKDLSSIPNVVISKVYALDSLIFGGTNISICKNAEGTQSTVLAECDQIIDFNTNLSYSNNDVSFYYSLPFYEEELKNEFTCLLVGRDKHWSDWQTNTKREYFNLSPGSYVFKVKARNLYRAETKITEFHFTVLPPWYRTYYAYIFYFCLLVAMVVLIVKFYTYRLVQEKLKLEGLVRERTKEISMQKEEILIQSEYLKEANDWISTKNEELETQKSELELSNATKNKFFRIIAHDLRNPISTSVSTTEFILSSFDKADRETLKVFVEKLQNLSIRTFSLLENLLDWSTSQMGQITFRPKKLELDFLVNETVDLTRSVIESKNISIELNIPRFIDIYADENMLRTVLRNLLSNAIKFTHPNGNIKIWATAKNDFCYLSVEDNGVGIPDENLKNLFRIDKDVKTNGTNNEKGSGLGLIICKEFIAQNGGTISVQSELGKGSVFTISVKLAEGRMQS